MATRNSNSVDAKLERIEEAVHHTGGCQEFGVRLEQQVDAAASGIRTLADA
jgi:hypothetical protein